MKNRGQFFLISALIIAGIIASLGTIYSYARASEEDFTVKALGDSLSYEIGETINNFILSGSTSPEILDSQIDEIVNASLRGEQDILAVVIYGRNAEDIRANSYNAGSITLLPFTVDGTIVRAEHDNVPIEFALREGINIHVVLIKEANNEKIVYFR